MLRTDMYNASAPGDLGAPDEVVSEYTLASLWERTSN